MKTLTLSMMLAGVALAQPPAPDRKLEFEVASIRPASQDNSHSSHGTPGFFQTHNLTLKRLVASAYQVDMRQISGGPSWVDSDSFDIKAKIPEEFAHNTRESVPRMLQSLLADRFQLVIHRVPGELSGFNLVVAKKAKMEISTAGGDSSSINEKNTHLVAKNVTMEDFAKDLSRNRDIGKMVVDKTGLPGRFNFTLDYATERESSNPDPAPGDLPLIFTAIQQELGLKLESAKVPVLTIVIDGAQKPEGN